MKRNMMFLAIASMMAIQPRPWGEGEDDVIKKADVEKMISEAVAKATSGLDTKNKELLDENKRVKDSVKVLEELGGLDEAKKLQQLLASNEDMKLIKDGKIDELITKKLDKATSKFEQTITELKAANETSSKEAATYRTKYQTKMVEDSIRDAALKAGVRKEALGDAVLHGSNVFKLGEDGSVEARDQKGQLVKIDDALLTPELFVTNMKKTHPHYWPTSKGSGSDGDGDSGDDSEAAAFGKAKAALAAGDMTGYRAARGKAKPTTKRQ